MKKLLIISLFIVGLTACSDELLDVKNENKYDGSTFFTDPGTYEQAANAMYTPLLHGGMYSRDFYFVFDLIGNDAEKNFPLQAPILDFPNYSFTPNNPTIFSMWSAAYKMTQRSLFVLDLMDKWETDKEDEIALRKRLQGEALFMRSLGNFWLVTLWGDVPLRESFEDTELQLPRTPATTVWETIEADLAEAAELLPVSYDAEDLGRATKGAAIALLGKSHLYQKEYGQAITQFSKLTSAPFNYELESDYDDLFIYDKAHNTETIFAVMHGDWGGWGVGNAYYMFEGSETWGQVATHTGRAMEYGFNDWYNVVVSDALVDAFTYTNESGEEFVDPRAANVFYGPAESGGDTEFCDDCESGSIPYTGADYAWRKYEYYEFEEVHGVPKSNINSQVIRYADVLLMLAESYIETGEVDKALPLINQVRERSGAFAYTSLGSQEEAMKVLRLERQIELAGEQSRYFDLVRWGTLMETINKEKQAATGKQPVKAYHVLFPVPNTEREANPEVNAMVNNNWN